MPSRLKRVYLLFPVLLEVLLPLHCSASPSLVVGRQKHVAHFAEGQAHKSSGAVDGAPDPPVNLMVFPTSDTIVQLAWDEPSDTTDVDHYYVYVEGEDMDDMTDATIYIFTNLVACTNYTFGVQSVSAADVMSDPLLGDGTTDVGVPPFPRSLQVDDYTATTVTLSWDEPDTLCDVEEYRVKWSDDGIDTQSSKVTETSFTVTDLSKNTTYTFDVSGFTSAGEGDVETVQQTTAVDDGGPPEDLVAEGLSSSVISVSWSPPSYEPEYYVVTVMICDTLEELVFGLSYNITGLIPCDYCDVKVTSFYSATTQYSANVLGSSLSGDPPPPTGCSVTAVEERVTVTWNRPDSDCDLRDYSVNYTWTKLWGDGGEGSDGKITTATAFSVLYPVSYSTYSFNISSSIDDVYGSPTTCIGTSLETLPGAPVILNVDSEEGKVLVTWKAPLEENGVIVNYEIYVDGKSEDMVEGDVFSASVNLEPCKSVGLSVRALNGAGWGPLSDVETLTVVDDVLPKTVNCAASDLQVEVCWEPYSPTCPVSQYNLEWEGDVLWDEDLVDSNSTTMEWSDTRTCYNVSALPYTEYYVELSVGIKPDTISCSDITPMAAPGPPTNVDLKREDFAINVTWAEPVEKNGIIDFYQIEWTPSVGEDGFKTTKDNTTFSLETSDFSCGTVVNVTVRAKVTDVNEFGEKSPLQTAYVVNSVDTLDCRPSSSREVSLNWTPEDPDCPVGFYNVTWTYESLWSDDTGQGSKIVENAESATVDSLFPYSSVVLQIHVDNDPEFTDCTAITLEEVSSPPTDLRQIDNDTSSVTVQWGLPVNNPGKLTGWHLTWTTVDDTRIGESNITETEDMTYKINDLSSSSTYVVYVMALNGAGESPPANVNASTMYVPPSKNNTGLIIGLSVGGGILLIILLVGGFVLYRKQRSAKPPRSAPHMPEVADADSDELYKMQHLSSVSQRFQNKLGSVDYGTNSELYTSPRPSLPKDEPDVDEAADDPDDSQPTPAAEKGQMFGAPAGRRFSEQVSTNLPRLGAYSRRPSQQVNSRMRNFEEYDRRPSQQDLTGRPSLSGGPGKPSLGEFGRRPSQQIDIGRPNLREYGRRPSQQAGLGRPNLSEYGRRPSQQADLGRPNLGEYGRRPSQQADLGRPNLSEYGRRPSQQADLGKPRLGEYGRRPSQQVDLGRPRLAEYGRRASQQVDLGRTVSSEYARRPSQQLPSGSGSYPARLPHEGVPRRSSVDLHSRRSSQQTDIGRPGDRMFMKRPSQQFVMKFDEIQEL